ncbi:hypothetical protein PIB30_070018, partial [Stylosanthes scabra]|nr:hypothetical protein [Stylosanthes scabra]
MEVTLSSHFQGLKLAPASDFYSLILSYLGADREIGNLTYQFQAINTDNRLKYEPSWIHGDNHIWITFEVHRRVMQDMFTEFYAEVRQVG